MNSELFSKAKHINTIPYIRQSSLVDNSKLNPNTVISLAYTLKL